MWEVGVLEATQRETFLKRCISLIVFITSYHPFSSHTHCLLLHQNNTRRDTILPRLLYSYVPTAHFWGEELF